LSDVYHLPAAAAEGDDLLGAKAARLAARLLDDAGLAPGAALLTRAADGSVSVAEDPPAAWLEPLRALAAARGLRLDATTRPAPPGDGAAPAPGVDVPVAGRHFTRVEIAPAAAAADALLLAQRLGCHTTSGLAGAVAGLGLAFAAPRGRTALMAGRQPWIDRAICGGCGVCVGYCPESALRHDGHRGRLDPELCTGCGDCAAACFPEAIRPADGDGPVLQERLAEFAAGAAAGKPGRTLALLFVVADDRPRPRSGPQPPRLPDVGLLASADPVALDRAACDLVLRASAAGGAAGEASAWCGGVDPLAGLVHAEALGLGRRDYRLVRLD